MPPQKKYGAETMKKENNPLILCLFGILPVVWLGLLIAPAVHGGVLSVQIQISL